MFNGEHSLPKKIGNHVTKLEQIRTEAFEKVVSYLEQNDIEQITVGNLIE